MQAEIYRIGITLHTKKQYYLLHRNNSMKKTQFVSEKIQNQIRLFHFKTKIIKKRQPPPVEFVPGTHHARQRTPCESAHVS